MNSNQIIKGIIDQKMGKVDTRGNDYLILKLRSQEEIAIFVFSSKVDSKRWDLLETEKEYSFSIEKGKNESNILLDFKSEEENE